MEHTAEQPVPLESILKFLSITGHDELAKHFLATLDEARQATGTTLLNQLVIAREQAKKESALEAWHRRAKEASEFAITIKGWTNDQLIEWYGQHGPSARAFDPLGGEMDEWVVAVYKELFETNRIPQHQHLQIQKQILQALNEKFGTKTAWEI